MTAEASGHVVWSPDPVEQRRTGIRDTVAPHVLLTRDPMIRDIAP